MKIIQLAVKNYRGLRDITIPMSRFVCLIGENNSGKSSFLQALSLFFSGSKVSSANYFDPGKPLRIAVTFSDIGDGDLGRLADEHRTRVAEILKNGSLTLVRLYDTGGKSSLLYNALMPTEERYSSDSIATLLKGFRAGQAAVKKVVEVFPELLGIIDASMNKDAIFQKIQELADSVPAQLKTSTDLPLPTGIDRSIIPMLPQHIYIPAVKDLSDDVKTSESTPFGKILSILLQAVETQLPDAKELFDKLHSKLNRTIRPDGSEADERLDEVKLIEKTVEGFVQESFANVSLRINIPPPDLRTVFSSAKILADDGVEGLIDTKGDGLRRAVVFSILRSYVELSGILGTKDTSAKDSDAEEQEVKAQPPKGEYLLLFEEPELFLHPKAQHILFDALRVFSAKHHVVVTTHSPMFFGPQATGTFVKLYKQSAPAIASRPFALAHPVDLSDVNAKDQFQIICFENNNAAFFAETVVLVEGDSDYLVLPHVARTLNPDWDTARCPICFARITGKGNIRRYRDFFKRFNIRVPVITDLDLLLDGFRHIVPSEELKQARDTLLQKIDAIIATDAGDGEPTAKEAKKAHESGELRLLWKAVRDTQNNLATGKGTQQQVGDAIDAFFAWQRHNDRLAVLMTTEVTEILQLKWQVLELLRQQDVFVLERGAIEAYYPEDVSGPDKPSKAQCFCGKITSREDVLACCKEQEFQKNGSQCRDKEFNLIFSAIFGEPAVAPTIEN